MVGNYQDDVDFIRRLRLSIKVINQCTNQGFFASAERQNRASRVIIMENLSPMKFDKWGESIIVSNGLFVWHVTFSNVSRYLGRARPTGEDECDSEDETDIDKSGIWPQPLGNVLDGVEKRFLGVKQTN